MQAILAVLGAKFRELELSKGFLRASVAVPPRCPSGGRVAPSSAPLAKASSLASSRRGEARQERAELKRAKIATERGKFPARPAVVGLLLRLLAQTEICAATNGQTVFLAMFEAPMLAFLLALKDAIGREQAKTHR
jgi:hypothetical protein